MVQSKLTSVDAFMAELEPPRKAALETIRALCLSRLPGWEERMQWGMPGYGPAGGDAVVSFNNQKNYIAFYPGRTALEAHRDSLKQASFGKGCVRFANADRIDFEAISAMLDRVFANKGQPACG